MIKLLPRYEDTKTYPIIIKFNGYCEILEMLGKVANTYNDHIEKIKSNENNKDTFREV